MADTLSFKVRYQREDESHIRRFCLDKDVCSSFAYLKEKLCHVFPEIRRQQFSILWTDDEGDFVTVANDEDLVIAMTDMEGPLYKFCVKIGTKNKLGNKSEVPLGSIHRGVECDGCQGNVVGFRYKCLVCEDFDLCGDCEVSGHNSEHNMIRISNPQIIWPQQVFSPLRIINQYNEISNEEKSKQKKKTSDDSTAESLNIETLLGPVFEMMVKVLTADQTGEEKESITDSEYKKNQESKSPGCEMEESFTNLSKSMAGNSNNIDNRGSLVSDLLQPLSLSAPISIRQSDEPESTADQNIESDKEKKKEEEEKVNHVKESNEHEQPDKTVYAEKEKNSGILSPALWGTGNWYVVDNEIEDMKESNQKIPEILDGSSKETLYLTLPENDTPQTKVTEETVSIPSTSSESKTPELTPTMMAEHSDPNVRAALHVMMNMGFTNDGGWLTNLLEAKKGDIGKTLDVLQAGRS